MPKSIVSAAIVLLLSSTEVLVASAREGGSNSHGGLPMFAMSTEHMLSIQSLYLAHEECHAPAFTSIFSIPEAYETVSQGETFFARFDGETIFPSRMTTSKLQASISVIFFRGTGTDISPSTVSALAHCLDK